MKNTSLKRVRLDTGSKYCRIEKNTVMLIGTENSNKNQLAQAMAVIGIFSQVFYYCASGLSPDDNGLYMSGLTQYILPYAASQVISIIILYVAIKNTRLARLLFSLMFFYAGCYNMYIGFVRPDEYLGFADLAVPLYRDFINGWFSYYNYILIPVIALGQLAIAAGMLLQGHTVRLACMGAIIFLLSIAPLLVGSAFPFSITVSIAAFLIMRNDSMEFLWKSADD